MGLRKYERQIAKERMKALGIGNVNRNMGGKAYFGKGKLRKLMGCRHGRKLMNKLRQDGMARWRRVMYGDLARDAWLAQMRQGQVRARRSLLRKLRDRKMAEIAMKNTGALVERGR